MEWSEIDLDGRSWTLRGRRAKNGVEHVVPLAPPALAILAERKAGAPGCQFVFSANNRTPIASLTRTKRSLDAAMLADLGTVAPWVLHDLRRSAATHMAGLGVAPHIVEATLNHKSGAISGVAAIYNRFSYALEKRAALDLWAAELTRIVAPAAAPLARAA